MAHKMIEHDHIVEIIIESELAEIFSWNKLIVHKINERVNIWKGG